MAPTPINFRSIPHTTPFIIASPTPGIPQTLPLATLPLSTPSSSNPGISHLRYVYPRNAALFLTSIACLQTSGSRKILSRGRFFGLRLLGALGSAIAPWGAEAGVCSGARGFRFDGVAGQPGVAGGVVGTAISALAAGRGPSAAVAAVCFGDEERFEAAVLLERRCGDG